MLRIYEQLGFSLETAKTLLLMVERARDEFREDEKRRKSDKAAMQPAHWWNPTNEVMEIDGLSYEVLTRFGCDEHWWTPQNVLDTILNNVFDGDPLEGARTRVPFGFVLRRENNIYIVIRGTQTGPEWWNNLNFRPGCEEFLDIPQANVHRGFNHMYTKFNEGVPTTDTDDLQSIKDKIAAALHQCSTDAQVYLAGHSLGGALTTLAAAHVKNLNRFNKAPILYTFASPRVGDEEFQAYLGDIAIYRVVNVEDIIAYFPFPSIAPLPAVSGDEVLNKMLQTMASTGPLSQILPKFNFYHIGQPISFSLHKESILENHIIATYLEALNKE